MPAELTAAARGRGCDVRLYAIDGLYDGALAPDRTLGLGEVNRLRKFLTEDGVSRITFSGRFYRPDYDKLAWDTGAVAVLPKILKTGLGGDDAANRAVIDIMQGWGLEVIGQAEVAPDLLVAAGTYARKRPTKAQRADIAFGFAAIADLAPYDIGQAVVIHNGRILAVEAAEGTDAMIARIAALREAGRFNAKAPAGVVIKTAKPGQDMRLDIPVVGIDTIEAVRDAGLAGLAVGAGQVLVAEQGEVRAVADAAGLFLLAVEPDAER